MEVDVETSTTTRARPATRRTTRGGGSTEVLADGPGNVIPLSQRREAHDRDQPIDPFASTTPPLDLDQSVPSQRTAFVLGGGGSLGAVHVGMLRALLEHGLRPDLVVGTSIGALNAAFLVGHLDLEGIDALEQVWLEVRRHDVFPINVASLLRGLVGHQNHLFDHAGLRAVIAKLDLGFSRLEEAPLPVHVVATDLFGGEPVVLSHGGTIESLLASSAIPGVYPPVRLQGRTLIDGGVAANVAVSQAVQLGANRLFVLPAMAEALVAPPRNAIDMMQRSSTIATSIVARSDLQRASEVAEVHVLRVPANGNISMFDFGQSSALIAQAYEENSEWLQSLPNEVLANPTPATLTRVGS